MIRRFRRSLPWFGAVAAFWLLALPAQADDIEPEPYVEEEAEPEPEPAVEAEAEAHDDTEAEFTEESDGQVAKVFDAVLIRPLYFVRFVVGLPFFAFYPFTYWSDYSEDVVAQLWTDPVEDTFKRPLGVPEDDF